MEIDRITYYTRIIEELLNKNNISEELFWAYIERGISYFEELDYNKAISDFESAISIMPDESLSYYNLGMIYKERGDFDKAVYYMNKVISMEDNNANAYFELGVIMNEKGDYLKAFEYLSKAILCGRKTADVFYNRALILINLNKFEDAIKDINIAIKMKPSNSNYYIKRAQININNKDFKSAIDDFTSAIKLKPDYSSYRVDRAMLYASVGSWIKTRSEIDNKDSFIYKKAKLFSADFVDDSKLYYELALYDIDNAIENESKIYNSFKISSSYYLVRASILRSMNRITESIFDLIIAKENMKLFSKKNFLDIGPWSIPQKYYLMKAIIHLYLEEFDEVKKELDFVLNKEIFSSKLDILYACYWWKAHRCVEKTNFWFQRAIKNGFDASNLVDDIFEGYFLRDFIIEAERKNIIRLP